MNIVKGVFYGACIGAAIPIISFFKMYAVPTLGAFYFCTKVGAVIGGIGGLFTQDFSEYDTAVKSILSAPSNNQPPAPTTYCRGEPVATSTIHTVYNGETGQPMTGSKLEFRPRIM